MQGLQPRTLIKRLFSDLYNPDTPLPTVQNPPDKDLIKQHSKYYQYIPTLTTTELITEIIISLNTELLPISNRSILEREISSVNLRLTISANPLITPNRRTRKLSLLELTYRLQRVL